MKKLLKCGDYLTKHQEKACERLNDLIINEKYPYRFDNAKYISEGAYLDLSCFMGHSVRLQPYKIKAPYKLNSVRHKLPKCSECIKENITNTELKYRQDIFYMSGCEIEVIGRYIDKNTKIDHGLIERDKIVSISPLRMRKILRYYKGRSISDYEQLLIKKDKK